MMAESSTPESSDTGETSTEVIVTPTKTLPPPPPVFQPSSATDNDTYFNRYFKPLKGDIVLCNKLDYEPKDPKAKNAKKLKKGEQHPKPLLAKRAVTLYKDGFEETQLHSGDLILRRGMFELRTNSESGYQTSNEWCWKDLEMATIHVYWPNYHSKGNWFKVTQFPITHCLGTLNDPDAYRKARDLNDNPTFNESTGDIVVRRNKIQDPTRPWGWIFDVWQLQDALTEKEELRAGDIVVHACGHYFPQFKGSMEEREPTLKLKEPLFRIEVDCAWREPVTKTWLYAGQDAFCFKVKAADPYITQKRFQAVPKPGDILITQGQNLLRPVSDRDYSKGGYVQVYNDKRFFYPGDPPLKPVNVKGPGNMAIRFGHFNENWDWTPLPSLQLFHYHENEGAWYTLGPVILPYKWMVAPDYRFELQPIELNSFAQDLVPTKGDIIIRKPRPQPPKQRNPLIDKPEIRTGSYFDEGQTQNKPHPFWERIMKIVPYSPEAIRKYPLVQGDCLLRAGLEPSGPLSTAKYNATAELYMLVSDHWDRLTWVFRGRDTVFLGGPDIETCCVNEPDDGEETLANILGKRDLSLPSPEPRLAPRRRLKLKRRIADVLIETSYWNNPTVWPVMFIPEKDALLPFQDEEIEVEQEKPKKEKPKHYRVFQ